MHLHVLAQEMLRTLFLIASLMLSGSQADYANVTLTSRIQDGSISAVIYTPVGLIPDKQVYYAGSRFDHSSMIGSITLNTKSQTGKDKSHILYGTGIWRIPHNSDWPESGVGIASEFGVGDDGDFCNFRCGWINAQDVTNGVLGYQEVRNGETFLKIGVGELIKGSCPSCDSTEDYKFNSPYMFAKRPFWQMTRTDDSSLVLNHYATLRDHGYRLTKNIALNGNVLTTTNTLTNIGAQHFSTVWYSHNLFTCDDVAVGPGYAAELDLKGDSHPLYEEPGTWSWTKPLRDYATVTPSSDKISIQMTRALDPGIRIKTEFVDDHTSRGKFTLMGCDSSVTSSIPEVGVGGNVPMYAYSLYLERGTFSPEPQIYLSLDPGASQTWTQRLEINTIAQHPATNLPLQLSNLVSLGSVVSPSTSSTASAVIGSESSSSFDGSIITENDSQLTILVVLLAVCVTGMAIVRYRNTAAVDRSTYLPVPDCKNTTTLDCDSDNDIDDNSLRCADTARRECNEI